MMTNAPIVYQISPNEVAMFVSRKCITHSQRLCVIAF